jgi:hypothetical protein
MGCGVWVPAPVRNCALGRDDFWRAALAYRFRSGPQTTPLATSASISLVE